MRISRKVRAIRTAISPRLAMRTFLNIVRGNLALLCQLFATRSRSANSAHTARETAARPPQGEREMSALFRRGARRRCFASGAHLAWFATDARGGLESVIDAMCLFRELPVGLGVERAG